ncbi:ATP-binding protein [Parabacteroides distasonis]|uniref:ATP-binding protein n=1 Tax=Parabacteroides distasonis TaxID=823 RepID=UPI00189D61E7|nr:ATP-binding protein [Parabacteroides distasonis]MDB9152311.1 ATP-binding protein [Parabacteroides distasonis]MDB9156867.1 ATP-binding protein [Parabacteroides distasonis]MDB9165567.1 ATP-binding protein [Parabacteroides distasonis]MDB9170399.1 ATP-binding protein [Parabacteroides distasonis]MDB9193325.1 ATP-binding protein [Parabacteroides distasonis]
MNKTIYPIGIQNFEKIRKGGYLYIDKTALIYQLANTGSYYFLSRPRRFGKSLLLSTLEAYFQGKKELFEGLAIEKLEKEWTEYPILHLDLNIARYASTSDLEDILNRNLVAWEKLYGADPAERSLPLRFAGIIDRAYHQTGQRAVILIDEYDKPLLQNLHDEETQNQLRNMLKPFYGVLKTMDRAIRFALLTGVTKFGKVSVFSDLNNLDDISMRVPYAAICGITEEELRTYFEDDIHELASSLKLTYDETRTLLKRRYDGYHFVAEGPGLYNPFSLLNTFKYMRIDDYWFETGTPSYLVELLKHTHYDLYEMANTETDADTLNSIDSASNNPIPVIYQSGYLTIKDYDPEFKIYRLGFPNREVEEGFIKYLLPFYTSVSAPKTPFEIGQFVREVRSGNYDAFFRRLQSFFADTPYEVIAGQKPERDTELHYQNVLFIVFRLVGLYTKVEYHTSNGRIDLVLQTDRYIYIMEFKLNGTAEEALRQIDEKQYALPFANDERKLFKIGVNFSSETRNIEKWMVE